MFRKSVIDETVFYKLFWQFFNNSVIYLSLFLFFLYLYKFAGRELPDGVLLTALIGIVLELVISTSKSTYAKLLANILPFLFTFMGLLLFAEDQIKELTLFLGIFIAYSIVNSFGQELMNSMQPLAKSVSFMTLQLTKILALAAIALVIETSFPLSTVIEISVPGFTYENTFSAIFLLVNLTVIIVSFLAAMLQLIIRNTSLTTLSNRLKQISSWSLDQEVIEQKLTKNEVALTHEHRTILIGDIRGFSAFSEKTQIKTVMFVLEHLYEIIERVVEKHKGYKPEFIADEFITFFQNSKDAVACAIKLRSEINEFLEEHNLAFGMGLDRGIVLEGIVGGKNSRKYTVLGRAVNVAARLQAIAEGDEILATARIVQYVKNLKLTKLKQIDLKGVKRKISIYRILDFKPRPISTKGLRKIAQTTITKIKSLAKRA